MAVREAVARLVLAGTRCVAVVGVGLGEHIGKTVPRLDADILAVHYTVVGLIVQLLLTADSKAPRQLRSYSSSACQIA